MSVRIFCCYAHEDEILLNKLKSQLRPLQRQGLINVWHDRDISAGTEWEREISEQLNTAQIILLLVSSDFMDSDYCYSVEMKRALELHEAGEVCVIPIILRHIYWQGTLGKLQALPTKAIPVTDIYWHSLDKAFFDIAEGILNKVNELSANLLLAEKKKKQLAIDMLERKITQACIADDDLAIVATHTANQRSPYARYLILKPQLQRRLEIAQEHTAALTNLRTVLARKKVAEIGNEFNRRPDIFKYLTEDEWNILTLATIFTEIYTNFSNEDLAIWYVYEQIQSSPYKDALIFTEQEQQRISLAKKYADNLDNENKDTKPDFGDNVARVLDALCVKCLCPSCSNEFYPGDCRIISGIYSERVLKGAPQTGIEQLRYRINPEPLTGPMYTRELACRECPHCGYRLPYNIEIAQNISIVIIGDTCSGMSTYLTTLLHEIQEEWVPKNKNHVQISCSTRYIELDFHRDCTQQLFQEKSLLDATYTAVSDDAHPLIYELKVSESPSQPAKTINLIFYHGAGEDYAILERLVSLRRYVVNASGIIYLADPTVMPEINHRIPPSDQNMLTGRRASYVLSQLIALFERQFSMGSESHLFSIPIAITLPKSDLLKHMEGSNESYHFLRNPKNGYNGSIDLQDLQTVDTEVRKLIYDYGDRMLLQIARGLKAQFFAVSATGCSPDTNGNYPLIEPHRCLDPFLWILYQLGVINADGT